MPLNPAQLHEDAHNSIYERPASPMVRSVTSFCPCGTVETNRRLTGTTYSDGKTPGARTNGPTSASFTTGVSQAARTPLAWASLLPCKLPKERSFRFLASQELTPFLPSMDCPLYRARFCSNTSGPERLERYDPAPILDLQFCTDLAQGAAGSAEEIHRIRTHLSGYAFDQREFPESRTNWKGSGLELVDCLTREEYAELGWRLGAMLQGTRASLILVEDVDADLGSKGICRLPYWFRKTSLDHPGSALMISVREPHTAEAIAKASKHTTSSRP